MTVRRNLVRNITILAVPLVATAVIGTTAGLYVPSPTDISTRSEQVELVATIDTAATTAGIADSNLYFMNQSDLNTAMQQMQTMGVTQIRVLLPWAYMETKENTYSWTQADQLLKTAAKYGMAVEATITSTPTWATQYSAGGVIANGQPNSVTDYASFVQAVAARYGSSNNAATGLISAIEVWNEPNGFTGWYPTPTAQGYTDLLKAAYTAIKSVAPGITVVGGVLGAGITIGSLTINPVNFLQQMYADGAAGFFDALSFHPYNYTATFSAGTTFVNSAIKQLQALRALLNANGDAAKLIWATEYGEPSSEKGGQAQQAAYIQDFLTTWSSLAGVGPMFLYSLLPDGQGDNLNIFNPDWTAKAAVAVIEAWITAHPPGAPPATSIPGTIVDTVGQLLANIGKALSNAVSSVVSGLSSALSGVTAAVSHAVNSLVSSIGNALKALLSGGAKPTAAAVAARASAKAAAASSSTGTDAKSVAAVSTSTSKSSVSSDTDAAKPATKRAKKAHSSSSDAQPATNAADTRNGRKHAGKADSTDSDTPSTVNTIGTEKGHKNAHKKDSTHRPTSSSATNKTGSSHKRTNADNGRRHH
jgi:hypothetical protein